MSLKADDFKCMTQTQMDRKGMRTIMTKHFKLTHDGCEVKFDIENAINKSTKDCNT